MERPLDPPYMSEETFDLETELDLMLEQQMGTSVVSTVLEMASELTLGDLKELAAKEPGAAGLTLSDVFAEYVTEKNLVRV